MPVFNIWKKELKYQEVEVVGGVKRMSCRKIPINSDIFITVV
jgi:hypothetical protein